MLAATIGIGAALAVGVALLAIGLRGRRTDDHPVCRKCGRDLTGVESPRCPECGRPATRPRIGNRRRRPLVAATGGVLAAAALLSVVGGGALLLTPERSAARKPAWLLRWESGLGVERSRRVAAGELARRLRENAMAEPEVAATAAAFLADQRDDGLAWEPVKGDFLRMANKRGFMDDAAWHRFVERGVAMGLSPRPRAWAGGPRRHGNLRSADLEDEHPAKLAAFPALPVRLDRSRMRLASPGGNPIVYLTLERPDDHAEPPPPPDLAELGSVVVFTDDGQRVEVDQDALLAEIRLGGFPLQGAAESNPREYRPDGPAGMLLLPAMPGRVEAGPAVVTVRAATAADRRKNPFYSTRPRPGLDVPRLPVELVADAAGSVPQVDADAAPSLAGGTVPAEAMAWLLVKLRSGVGDMEGVAGATLRPRFDVPAGSPALAYGVEVDAGDGRGRRRIGSLLWRPGDATAGVEMTDARPLRLDPRGVRRVTLTLAPDVRLAERQVDVFEVAGGEVAFEDVPLRWDDAVAEVLGEAR